MNLIIIASIWNLEFCIKYMSIPTRNIVISFLETFRNESLVHNRARLNTNFLSMLYVMANSS